MNTVTSKDGTTIAFDQTGTGPALILVGGFPDRSANTQLAGLLSSHFTVINYDRRGRGDSGDTMPYALERDFDDLQALIEAAGGSVLMYGTSGGAIMALEAASRGLAITKLALWEPPYILEGSRPPVPSDYLAQLEQLIAADRRGDALELFFVQAVGMPAQFVTPMRMSPFWGSMEKVAHTLVYDAILTGDFSLPAQRFATITVPTLVIDGGMSPWLSQGAQAVADALPHAQRRTLTGQPHNVDSAVIAPALAEFLAT